MIVRRIALALLAGAAAFSVPSSAQDPETVFHNAYFLEKERGLVAEALALYERVAHSEEASAALRQEASGRAAALSEDVASLDFARLVPAETILYAELSQPGRALALLLEGLGLLGSFEDARARGTPAISPELVRGALGIRGAALALTRLPEGGAPPGGVLLLHAGEVAVLRGLIETAIPLQGTSAEPIEGVPSWVLPGGVQVTLARRLVIASTDREEIAGVLRRLSGKSSDGLASNPAMASYLARRDGGPFFCCLNAAPVRPILRGLLEQQSVGNPQAAMLAAALDVSSLEGCLARAVVGEDGVALDAELFLAKDHKNLVFNLLRSAPLDPATLDLIPQGVAAFVATALNERGPALAPLERNPEGAAVISAMDFGRELFANVAGVALYVLPGRGPLPNAALVLSSNDPARSGAILSLLLGFANLAATGRSLEAEEDEIAGERTQVFRLPPGLPLYLTTHENMLILSPSEELIAQAIQGRSSGRSILHDEAFTGELGRLDKDTTLALCAHLGRALSVLQPYLGEGERAEVARIAPALEHTVVALRTAHSDAELGLSLTLHGLPKIDGLVSEFLAHQKSENEAPRPAPDSAFLQAAFDRLAAVDEDGAAARAFVRGGLRGVEGDARGLNNFAWALLTEARYGQRFDDLAVDVARAANEASGFSIWQYLDTLALAKFRTGAVHEAVELELRALEHAGEAKNRAEAEAALARYREAEGRTVATDMR